MGQANQKPKQTKPPKWEPPVAPALKKKKRRHGPDPSARLPKVYPGRACLLRQLRLERCQDFLLMEEEFLKTIGSQADAHSNLELGGMSHYEAELKKVEKIRGTPLSVATLEEEIDDNHMIVSIGGVQLYVPILSFVDREEIELGRSVLLEAKQHFICGVLRDNTDPLVTLMKVEKAPTETYADVGGLENQIQEIKEAVEYPLSHPELYEEIGVKPPKGVILYGVPGTGKTLLAKAVANQTSATFLRLVGSELIQKYAGEGPKLVRQLFRIDAIGTKRYDTDSSGTKEVQRTMLELLTQLDGFDSSDDVKVIMATNRIDTLDPALIRPGRIDRKIEFPFPDEKTKQMIFKIHTSKMSLAEDMSGADIKAICTEAGLLALRDRRMKVCQADFVKGKENVQYRMDKSSFSRFYL
eukprot:gene4264-3083_t